MKGDKAIILCLMLIVSIAIAGAGATTVKNQNEEVNDEPFLTTAAPNVIDLGKMTILDKECKIELRYDNIVPIEECSPYETYAFVMQYYMHETNICQEKWVFRMEMQTGTTGESFIKDSKIIEDDWLLTDEADGELWIELPGHKLWDSREYNYITIDCELYSDILWVSNLTLVDESHEMTQVTVQSYLAPQLEWNAMDGTEWGKVGVNDDPVEKKFILKNTGSWAAENIDFSIIGYDDFKITDGAGPFNLDPNEQHLLTVTFDPSSNGEKTAYLSAHDEGHVFNSEELELKGTGGVKSKTISINQIFLKIFERYPMLEKLLSIL